MMTSVAGSTNPIGRTMSDDNIPPRPNAGAIPMRQADSGALPPHPLDKRWFAHVDGKNYGPYTGHEVKRMVAEGQVQESDFLCQEGGTAWVQAKNEPLLGALFRSQPKQPQVSTVTTGGGTIVQVTNNIPNNAANLAGAALLLSGDAAPKSPGIALLLSLLICGVGQMYNGQRWSRFPGQFGGLAKMDSGFDYAANFSGSMSIS